MNLSTKQKQIHKHREQTCGCQGEGGGQGMGWEDAVSRCKLLHREWINSKIPLYSTRNCIQYPVITIMEKNMKTNIYIYIYIYIYMLLLSCFSIRYGVAAATSKSLQSCPTLCDPIYVSPPSSLSLVFSRQEQWSRLPFPSPMHESEK